MPHIIEFVSMGLVFGPTSNPPPKNVAVFPLTVKFINAASVSRINIPPPKDAVLSFTVTFVNVTSELLIIIPPPKESSV